MLTSYPILACRQTFTLTCCPDMALKIHLPLLTLTLSLTWSSIFSRQCRMMDKNATNDTLLSSVFFTKILRRCIDATFCQRGESEGRRRKNHDRSQSGRCYRET